MTPAVDAVAAHVARYFDGHAVDRSGERIDGPIYKRVPNFEVLVVGPGPRLPQLSTFVTLGCWDAAHTSDGHGTEFMLIASSDEPQQVLRLAMNAYYHAGPAEQRLGVGHTVPIGEAWSDGSQLDHLLVSTPYSFGLELEWCNWDGGHAQLVWLLPITEAERDYKAANGLEALEQRFEETSIHYWDPNRPSVA